MLLISLLLAVSSLRRGYVQAQKLEVNLCDKFASANSSVLPYSFSNNAWGNDTGLAVGYQCLAVYDAGASWTATYKWDGDPTVVKAYPRMRAWPSNLPLQLNTLSQLLVNANYRTFLTDGGDSDQAYQSAGLVANVAMDLFVAPTAEQAIQISPPTEIMVWPWWTPSILPLGYDTSTPEKDTIEVNGATWSLYHGINDGGQNVFSWLIRSNVTSLNGDYAPLVKYLVDNGYLSGDLWASQLQLGQEMKLARQETNFKVDVSELRVVRSDEGERSAITSPSPDPVTSTLPPSSSLETTLVTPTVAPSPDPAPTTTTESPAPAPQTSEPSTSAAPPPTTTTTDPPESSAPPPTTTEDPAPATTTSPPPSSTAVTSTTTVRSSTTLRSTMTTTTQQPASTTEAAPTTTTSNAASGISRRLEDSWFMLLIALVAGFA